MEEVIDERYQNGKIYKICKIGADENDKFYIGSTIELLNNRFRKHKGEYIKKDVFQKNNITTKLEDGKLKMYGLFDIDIDDDE